jgi:hypothetical protein
MFEGNMSPAFSGSKNKAGKKPHEAGSRAVYLTESSGLYRKAGGNCKIA